MRRSLLITLSCGFVKHLIRQTIISSYGRPISASHSKLFANGCMHKGLHQTPEICSLITKSKRGYTQDHLPSSPNKNSHTQMDVLAMTAPFPLPPALVLPKAPHVWRIVKLPVKPLIKIDVFCSTLRREWILTTRLRPTLFLLVYPNLDFAVTHRRNYSPRNQALKV
ncbi:hypothetical protein BDZ89DRAFT_834979 [Hymenopellis radicata]|nr:hypothetical protein BDZ89DRAFT_834979 [Hymenopellis radicata]